MKEPILAALAFLFVGATALPGCAVWWHHHHHHHRDDGYRNDGSHPDRRRDERRGELRLDHDPPLWEGRQRHAANQAENP